MHPIGSLLVGGVAGGIFVSVFQIVTNKWQMDDVLGVWPLHGLCGLWGGIACGIFGLKALGGMGGVSFASQLVGSLMGAAARLARGLYRLHARRHSHGLPPVARGGAAAAQISPCTSIGANPEEDVRTGGRV